MKFCPYGGVSLPGNPVSFCHECGKQLPTKKTNGMRQQKKRPQHQSPKQTAQHRSKPVNPMDVNYDGYYDDIQPIDAGVRGEGMDPGLAKRIALLIIGAVGIIALAVIMMTLL